MLNYRNSKRQRVIKTHQLQGVGLCHHSSSWGQFCILWPQKCLPAGLMALLLAYDLLVGHTSDSWFLLSSVTEAACSAAAAICTLKHPASKPRVGPYFSSCVRDAQTVLHGAMLWVKHELSLVASAFVPLLTSSCFIPQRDQTAYFLSWLLSNYLSKQCQSIFPFPICHYELFSSKLLPLKGKVL